MKMASTTMENADDKTACDGQRKEQNHDRRDSDSSE